MLNFVICDDNLNVLDRLCKILDSIFINNRINAKIALKTTDAFSVLEYTKDNSVNVLILDIDLRCNMSGLDLAKKIRETNKDIYIIFTTGHLEYVMLAYKVKTFDFLAKTITEERLEETILRLINDMQQSPKQYIKIGKTNTFINQNDINYIKKDGTKLVFYTTNGKYESYNSFNKIQSCLSDNFVRCHKSYIANINKINNIESNNVILFSDNAKCEIGPKYKNNLMEVFNNGNFTNDLE